jgi:hypothetical protein
MYKDLTNGKLDEAMEFAKKIGLEDSLLSCLNRLNNHCSITTEVNLGVDFAPYSFAFAVLDKETKRLLLNGGIIYHGSHDGYGNGSAPTFSVSFSNEEGWQIHT